jgi:hypothetical protein
MESYQKPFQPSFPGHLFDLQIDRQSTLYLTETARWGKFLSIMGFIMIGLCTVGFAIALVTGVTRSSAAFAGTGYEMNTFQNTILPIVMIVLFLIYFFPTLYLYRFSTLMQKALLDNDQETMNNSFGNLKSAFKFVGLLTIIMLCLYGLLFIGGILYAVTVVR